MVEVKDRITGGDIGVAAGVDAMDEVACGVDLYLLSVLHHKEVEVEAEVLRTPHG